MATQTPTKITSHLDSAMKVDENTYNETFRKKVDTGAKYASRGMLAMLQYNKLLTFLAGLLGTAGRMADFLGKLIPILKIPFAILNTLWGILYISTIGTNHKLTAKLNTIENPKLRKLARAGVYALLIGSTLLLGVASVLAIFFPIVAVSLLTTIMLSETVKSLAQMASIKNVPQFIDRTADLGLSLMATAGAILCIGAFLFPPLSMIGTSLIIASITVSLTKSVGKWLFSKVRAVFSKEQVAKDQPIVHPIDEPVLVPIAKPENEITPSKTVDLSRNETIEPGVTEATVSAEPTKKQRKVKRASTAMLALGALCLAAHVAGAEASPAKVNSNTKATKPELVAVVESKTKKAACEARKQDDLDNQHDLASQAKAVDDLVTTSELARHQSGLFDHHSDVNMNIYPGVAKQQQELTPEDMAEYIDTAVPQSRVQLVR